MADVKQAGEAASDNTLIFHDEKIVHAKILKDYDKEY
jgi:hypothetical protein